MFFIIIILFTFPIFGYCSTRDRNDITREKPEKEPSTKSKRIKPLEPDELIPMAEGSEKNPDPGEMIQQRSKKSGKMRRSKKVKGFVVKQDRSVRRLENGKQYKSKTSLRFNRSVIEKPSRKSKKSSRGSKKSKKSRRSKEYSKKSEQSSKKGKKSESEKKLEKKKSSTRDNKDHKRKENKEEIDQKEQEEEEVKPKKLRKLRDPFKNLFKLKRKKARNDVHVEERNGTWA